MWRKSVVLVLYAILVAYIPTVGTQVCTKEVEHTKYKWKLVEEPYVQRYTSYCFQGRCVKTRNNMRTVRKFIPIKQIEQVKVCCPGYRSETTRPIVCYPECIPDCINGYCNKPNECQCNFGYERGPDFDNICVPNCSGIDCEYGNCTAPLYCECLPGYTRQNDKCRPVCTKPCFNGECIAPDTCACYEGYKKSDYNECEPDCPVACDNGICIAGKCICLEGYSEIEGKCEPICSNCIRGKCLTPNICQCETGYTNNNGTCEPVCRKDCGKGICNGPDLCLCDPGYDFDPSCDPYCCVSSCSIDCENGKCVGPEECICDPGYTRDEEDEICVPVCKNCGNGTCIEPGVCHCSEGYKTDKLDDSVCLPECQYCEGKCIEPHKCICEPPYETVIVPVHDEDCDTFLKPCFISKTTCVKSTEGEEYGEISDFESTTEHHITEKSVNFVNNLMNNTNVANFIFTKSQDYLDDENITYNFDSTTEGLDTAEAWGNNQTKVNQEKWYSSIWFYVTSSTLAVIIILMLVAFVIFKVRTRYSGSYVPNTQEGL